MTATDPHDVARGQLQAAMSAGDDVGAIRLRRRLRDLDAAEPIRVDGWWLVPLDMGDDGPVTIAVRETRR